MGMLYRMAGKIHLALLCHHQLGTIAGRAAQSSYEMADAPLHDSYRLDHLNVQCTRSGPPERCRRSKHKYTGPQVARKLTDTALLDLRNLSCLRAGANPRFTMGPSISKTFGGQCVLVLH